jgi:quercetin dioxygenase-like cupin family protein
MPKTPEWAGRRLGRSPGCLEDPVTRTRSPRVNVDRRLPVIHRRHRPGTLHHTYVLTGKISIGPVGEQVSVSRGDFIRFPGDVPHQTQVLSDTAVLHMVTTIPHVAQLGPGHAS